MRIEAKRLADQRAMGIQGMREQRYQMVGGAMCVGGRKIEREDDVKQIEQRYETQLQRLHSMRLEYERLDQLRQEYERLHLEHTNDPDRQAEDMKNRQETVHKIEDIRDSYLREERRLQKMEANLDRIGTQYNPVELSSEHHIQILQDVLSDIGPRLTDYGRRLFLLEVAMRRNLPDLSDKEEQAEFMKNPEYKQLLGESIELEKEYEATATILRDTYGIDA